MAKKPLSLPVLAFITINLMLLHIASSQEVTRIIFNNFNEHNKKDLILQGDVSISSSKELQLTKVDSNGNPLGDNVGRALYSKPIHLWDKSTGKAASIYTTFIYRISSPSNNPPADGLTFFFASPDTTIPPNSGGGFLGLFNAALARNNSRDEFVGLIEASSDKVVAVEFDTYPNLNLGDPDYTHIGIDVNSIKSEVTREWGFQNGREVAVRIEYLPVGKKLRVYATYLNGRYVQFTHNIDLTKVLPEYVRVGFSGSTGLYSQVNNIISWSFGSVLRKSNVVEEGGIASVV